VHRCSCVTRAGGCCCIYIITEIFEDYQIPRALLGGPGGAVCEGELAGF
jgi:hypothetical protein